MIPSGFIMIAGCEAQALRYDWLPTLSPALCGHWGVDWWRGLVFLYFFFVEFLHMVLKPTLECRLFVIFEWHKAIAERVLIALKLFHLPLLASMDVLIVVLAALERRTLI